MVEFRKVKIPTVYNEEMEQYDKPNLFVIIRTYSFSSYIFMLSK